MRRGTKVAIAVAAVTVIAAAGLTFAVVTAVTSDPGADTSAGPSESTQPSTPPTTSAPTASEVDCTGDSVAVTTAAQLTLALEEAEPGTLITLGAGMYPGNFVLSTSGTPDAPVRICGPADAVLDGGRIEKGYVLHLDSVSHVHLAGFSIQNGQKGLMADATTNSVIDGLTISGIGDEALHLRAHSTDNLIVGNTISDTGNRREKFGEGIYVGTAESNWCDISDCEPDRSDRNVIRGNDISGTTAESLDLKEGTSGGTAANNTFDGSALVEDDADSWVDVKGNDWVIEGNVGTSSPRDGFQTHEILDGWGDRNVFRSNTATVDGPGLGFSLTPELDNTVTCDNTATGAGEGLSNVDCSS